METRSGRVVSIGGESKVAKATGKPFRVNSVTLDTGDVIEVGFKQPYKVGDVFNSEVEFGYGKWKELKALGGGVPAPGVAPTMTQVHPPAQQPMAFPIPKANKETAIIRQNALTNAVNAVFHMSNNGLVGASDSDAYINQIIETAYVFAEFSSGQREIRLSKEMESNGD